MQYFPTNQKAAMRPRVLYAPDPGKTSLLYVTCPVCGLHRFIGKIPPYTTCQWQESPLHTEIMQGFGRKGGFRKVWEGNYVPVGMEAWVSWLKGRIDAVCAEQARSKQPQQPVLLGRPRRFRLHSSVTPITKGASRYVESAALRGVRAQHL